MKFQTTIFLIIIGQWLMACNEQPTVSDVKLVAIVQTDTPRQPPPPPPPISDFMTFQEWLFKLCDTENPDKSIIAYNFGLFETEYGYTIYLTGSKEYDRNDPDWAINNDFEPSMKFYPLPEKEYKQLKWELVLNRVTSQLMEFTKTSKFKNSYFEKAKAITAGFDDGDLVKIK